MSPENLQKILDARARNDTATTLKILDEDAKERLAAGTKQEDKKKEVLKAFGIITPRSRYTEPPIKRMSERYPGVEEIR